MHPSHKPQWKSLLRIVPVLNSGKNWFLQPPALSVLVHRGGEWWLRSAHSSRKGEDTEGKTLKKVHVEAQFSQQCLCTFSRIT